MSTSIFVIFEYKYEEMFQELLRSMFSEWKISTDRNMMIISNEKSILSIYRYEWNDYRSLNEPEEMSGYEIIVKNNILDPLVFSLNCSVLKLIVDIIEAMCRSYKFFIDNDHGIVADGFQATRAIKRNAEWLHQSALTESSR